MILAPNSDLIVLSRRLGSFADLTESERTAIESLPAESRVLGPRRNILCNGDRPTHCCVVLSGWAYRYKRMSSGKHRIISFHVPGDVPNLHCLHLPAMEYNFTTLTACRVAFIPHDALHRLTQLSPGMAALLWRYAFVEGAISREWMVVLGRGSAHERIAHLLCEMYLKLEAVGLAERHCYDFPASQGDIADALALSVTEVNRVVQEFTGRGLISLRGRSLAIHDWMTLTVTADFNPSYLHQERCGGA